MKPTIKPPRGYRIFKPKKGDKKIEGDVYLRWAWVEARIEAPFFQGYTYARRKTPTKRRVK